MKKISQDSQINLIDQFEKEMEITYKDESYIVRDNGAVFRKKKPNKNKRPLDEHWTFGKRDKQKGYMNIASHPIHRIVAYAFLGDPPSSEHVVDHIDTNKCNNRPENLRWVTRLENIILNPITLKRIETAYGSLEEFFNNPKKEANLAPNISWMRRVSKEEAQNCKKQLLKWAKSNKTYQGGHLSEWIYQNRTENNFSLDDKLSLTPGVMQRNWKWSTAFPACPGIITDDPLQIYMEKLKPGVVFTKNDYGESIVEIAERNEKFISVILKSENIKPWSVVKITVDNNQYVHEFKGLFFELNGAKSEHYKLLGIPFDGDSIDNYC